MGKIIFSLEIPQGEPRKKQPPAAKAHRDKKSYSRKTKHKARQEQNSPERYFPGSFYLRPNCAGVVPGGVRPAQTIEGPAIRKSARP